MDLSILATEFLYSSAGVSNETLQAEAQKGPILLEHEKEWKLSRTLLKLPDVLLKMADDLYLHPLCEYLYEVSTVWRSELR